MNRNASTRPSSGFTLVEVGVIIAVIGILATIVIMSVGSWRTRVAVNEVLSDLNGAKTAMENARNFGNGYPASIPSTFTPSNGVIMTYVSGDLVSYCLDAVSRSRPEVKYFLAVGAASEARVPMEGSCATGGSTPGPILANAGWSQITAGMTHTCLVYTSKAYCVGTNISGQLGNNTTTSEKKLVPVHDTGVLSGKSIDLIAAGSNHSCALAGGQVYCWGRNNYGQLGNGSNTNSTIPVAVNTSGVLSGKTITALSASGEHTCVIANGEPICWGMNNSGQLGDSSTVNSSNPVAVNRSGVLSGKAVTAISAGDDHTCVIASGGAYCWGNNTYGALGINTGSGSYTTPQTVYTGGALIGKMVTKISAGYLTTCAVADYRAYCWGDNNFGLVGDGTTIDRHSPVAVKADGVLNGKTIGSIDVSPSGDAACATGNGRAYCWGNNQYGQLGNNDTYSSIVPVVVYEYGALSGKSVKSTTVSGVTTCALTEDAKAYCWGHGFGGLLLRGASNLDDSYVPVEAIAP